MPARAVPPTDQARVGKRAGKLDGGVGGESCAQGNLLAHGRWSAHGVRGPLAKLYDGQVAQEGAAWNSAAAVRLKGEDSWIKVDLGSVRQVLGLVLQGDHNDDVLVEFSVDGHGYGPLWEVPRVGPEGLRTRSLSFGSAAQARYLRISARKGDGYYALSELQAYCELPAEWPPKVKQAAKKRYWAVFSNPMMVHVQLVAGCMGFIMLLFGFVIPYRFRPLRPHRLRDGACLGASLGCLWAALHTGLYYFSIAWGAFFLLWFGLRWASGSMTAPRLFAPIAKALSRPPGALLLVALWMATAAGVVHNHGWVPGCGVGFVGLLGAGLLRLLREPVSFPQTARIAIFCFGLFGLGSFWNFGHFHFDHFVHVWEQYHYVLGAKYGPELRYSRLYDCTSVADLEDGLEEQVRARKVRQLATNNELADTSAIIANPGLCTDRFSPERWEAFRKDLGFFRSRFSTERWDKSQTDHGYNATPVWALAARAVLTFGDTLSWPMSERLAAIDVVLILLGWWVVYRAFGMVPACVAMLYFGVNYPARFYWNGGGFLRYDWLLALMVGLACLRRQRPFAAGLALTYATALRIFPGFVVAALVLKALHRMVAERRFVLSPAHKRFAAGCLVALAVLIPASSWSLGGLDAWAEFAQNSSKHMGTALTNNMGLKTVLGYDFPSRAAFMRDDSSLDPFQGWKDARQYFYQRRAPLFWGLVALYCLLLAKAASRMEDWEVACLGSGLIVIASELTCYYYVFLLSYGLLWQRRKLPGAMLIGYGAFSTACGYFPWNDDRYMLMSVGAVVMVVAATAQGAFGGPRAGMGQGMHARGVE